MKQKLKPYPEEVCRFCAYKIRKVKAIGCITVYPGICGVCGKIRDVSTPLDYGWPDFPGFVKVKRIYQWD